MAETHVISRQIANLKKQIAEEEHTRNEWASALPEYQQMLGIESGPALDEITQTIAEIEEHTMLGDKKIVEFKQRLAALEKQLPSKPAPAAPKFDPEKHPILRKAFEKVEPAKPVVFNPGDICEVIWSRDKAWYKAKVQTVLGSASNPKYLVRFVDYDDTVTVGSEEIRPIESKKRKADGPPASVTPPVVHSPHVISGPASINPEALAAKRLAAPDTSVPINRRPIGSKKALERKASSWKDFMSKGAGKQIGKKESMFRSGTTVGSKVGFTGSGVPMTSNNKRLRPNKKDWQDDEKLG